MSRGRNSKMKVIHIISGDLWAGAEAMAFNLLRHLQGYPELDLGIILLNEGKLARKLRSIGATVHVLDEKQLPFWDIVLRTRAVLRTSGAVIVHSHRYKENILATLASGFNRSIKLIATQHGLPETAEDKRTVTNRFVAKANFNLLSRYFTATVAVSSDVRNYLVKQHAFREGSVEAIHNGIDIPETRLSRTGAGPFVIGSSGRLFPVKDYPLMVDIAGAIAAANVPDIRFALAGDGPERPRLEARIQGYGLQEQFILKGHQEDMDSFYRGVDLYLNSSVHEGIPMTILEALARGIPVIAPAVGGIREIITDGVEGFLIGSRNPQDFADKCLLLRDNGELREKMAKAARARAEQAFSADSMADRYYRLYRRVAAPVRQQQWHQSGAVTLAQ